MLHKYTHEAGWLKHRVLFNKKGLLRASGLPTYLLKLSHTGSDRQRGVPLRQHDKKKKTHLTFHDLYGW